MKCNNNDTYSLHQRQGKMTIMMFVLVATLSTLLVTMTVTQAFAAISLNSSKSNIYRSTQNANSNEGGSVEQTSTNTCNCPSQDTIVVTDHDSSEDDED